MEHRRGRERDKGERGREEQVWERMGGGGGRGRGTQKGRVSMGPEPPEKAGLPQFGQSPSRAGGTELRRRGLYTFIGSICIG